MKTIDSRSQLTTLEARCRLLGVSWREVEALGLQLLGEGHATAEVVDLASLSLPSSPVEVQKLLSRAMTSLGIELPNQNRAAELVWNYLSQEVSAGRISVVEATRQMALIARKFPELRPMLEAYVFLSDEYADDEANRLGYEQDMAALFGVFADPQE